MFSNEWSSWYIRTEPVLSQVLRVLVGNVQFLTDESLDSFEDFLDGHVCAVYNQCIVSRSKG